MILIVTSCAVAAAAILNFWLSMRIGKVRHQAKVSVGDGGNDMLLRRMRAQSNFIENTPLTLLLVALVELAGKGGQWLAPSVALFIVGRVCHGIGMDGNFGAGRPIGMMTTYLLQIALIVVLGLTIAAKF